MSLSVDSALRKAQTFEKRNDLVSATAIYQDILARFPANQRAITGYKRLQNNAKSEPSSEQIQNLVTLFNQGQLEATIAQSQTLIDNFPNSPTLWNILGVASRQTGNADFAELAFRKVTTLDPEFSGAHNNLGNALKDNGKIAEAIDAYRNALKIDPKFAEAHNNLGSARQEQGEIEVAIKLYKKAIALKPDYADAHNNLGHALHESGDTIQAMDTYEAFTKLQPENIEAYFKLGNETLINNNIDQAIKAYLKAIDLNPNIPEAHSNLGNALLEQGKLGEAIDCYKKAIALKPGYAVAYNNLGSAYQESNQLDHALDAYTAAVTIKPDYADAHFDLAAVYLRKSAFTAAWPEMEWRWQQKGFVSEPLLSQKPLWQGGRVERLLVWAEQGIGDEIMFNTCLPQIAQQCDRLIVSASKRLIPLFERSFNDITFVEAHNKIDEALYDLQAPALTALGQCRTSLDDFRATATPYLHADAARADTIKSRLKTLAGGAPIIGISWKSMNEKLGKRRSLDLPALAAAIPPDAFLVSLQYGDVAEEIAALKTTTGRIVHSYDGVDNFRDLDGFAALVSACDQVISIDNSTVHFAGALGIACHILLPFNPDWRWGLHGTKTSYWYAKTHLYWQPSPNDWQGCIDSLQTCFSAPRER